MLCVSPSPARIVRLGLQASFVGLTDQRWEGPGHALGKDIGLVEHEDERTPLEPATVGDTLPEHGRLGESVHRRVFEQDLVVFRDGRDKDEHIDVLEAVDPVFPHADRV